MIRDEDFSILWVIGFIALFFVFGLIPAYESLFSSRGYFELRDCVSNVADEVCYVSNVKAAISHPHQFVVIQKQDASPIKLKGCDVLSESNWDCENMRFIGSGVWGHSEFKESHKMTTVLSEIWSVTYLWRWLDGRSTGCFVGPIGKGAKIKDEECFDKWMALAK